MTPELPTHLNLLFIGTTLLTLYMLARATNYSKIAVGAFIALMVIQGQLAMQGFYEPADTMPPRFPLLILPGILLIAAAWFTASGRTWLDGLPLQALTWLHIVRIPVELGLHGLYEHGQIPRIMTYEGLNFDIFSGISAPVLALVAFSGGRLRKHLLLAWNILCLALLFTIVTIAILAAPSPFQQLALDQPNRAVQYFPFVWLPACIVPAVLFAHLASIRRLLKMP